MKRRNIMRNNEWIGTVGLMSFSDIRYADGWLYNQSDETLYPWSITPLSNETNI